MVKVTPLQKINKEFRTYKNGNISFVYIPITTDLMTYIVSELQKITNITFLTFCKTHIDDDVAIILSEFLKSNTTIRYLSLDQNMIGNIGAKHLFETIRVNTTINTFNISFNKFDYEITENISKLIKENETIRQLFIGGNKLCDTVALDIAKSLPYNKTLFKFDINNCILITPLGIHMLLFGLAKCPNINSFNIDSKKITYDCFRMLCSKWANTPTITQISVSNKTKLIRNSMEFLCRAFITNLNITSLDLSNLNSDKIDNDLVYVLNYIMQNYEKHNITSLNLRSNYQYFKRCIQYIYVLLSNTYFKIETLDISFNNISNAELVIIANGLYTNKTLKSLRISSNNFNDIVPLCFALKHNTTLTYINLTSQPVTEEPGNDVRLATIQSYIARNIVLRDNAFWCRRDHTEYKGDCHKMIMTTMLANGSYGRGIPYDILNYIFSFWQYKQFV